MKNDKLVLAQYYCGYDMLIEVKHETFNDQNCFRTYFITSEGISRHVDKENLDKCLSGEFKFHRDAIFFMKSRAICTAERLLDIPDLSENIKNRIQEKIEMWSNT